ncbi:MAG: hypothetical protein RLZZ399_2739, partial [Verrucomicrobiota bacterium]
MNVTLGLAIANVLCAAPPPAAIPVTPSERPSQYPAFPAQLSPPSASYRLSPNDVVHIRVFQEEDLETSARISKNGTIPFPLLGNIPIGSLTVQEASSRLEAALREYLVRPQVALRIIDFAKRKFTVLGQVSRPGTFDFPDDSPLSLLEGIGMAGGYTRIANPSKITVKRVTPAGEQIFELNGKKMAREKSAPRFDLLPGDTVVVEESL